MNDEKISIGAKGISKTINNMNGVSKALELFADKCSKIISSNDIETVTKSLLNVSYMLKSFDASFYMMSFKEAMVSFLEAIEQAQANPNSYFNYIDYQKKLDVFHWAWPYGISSKELKTLLGQAENEKEFDRLMLSFFSKERVDQMCTDTLGKLPRKHRKIYSQIVDAYEQKQYALINNAIVSIIDNLLCIVLKNKGNTNRKGILKPIVKFYADNYALSDIGFIFELQMLSNNIDLLFGDYTFSGHIALESNKKIRRHLSAHGVMYSNKKGDSIMLLNTLIAVLNNMKYIILFESCLIRKNKLFVLGVKDYVVVNRVRKTLGIEKQKI